MCWPPYSPFFVAAESPLTQQAPFRWRRAQGSWDRALGGAIESGRIGPMTHERDAAEHERIAQVLANWANRDPAARDQLVPIVYEELRRLAHHYMRGERED